MDLVTYALTVCVASVLKIVIMSLKENVSIWNEGIIQFDAEKYLECIHTFKKIADFSAKIVFNIGSVSMVLKDYDQSSKVQYI